MIESITLQNYKNLNSKYSFNNRITLITGENGKGKSNLLESIFLIINGFSYRDSDDIDLVSWSFTKEFNIEPFFNITGKLGSEERQIVFQGKKTYKINGKVKRAYGFSDDHVAIIFTPSSIDLISKTPSERRDELDTFISLLDSSYKKEMEEYRKSLRSRNKILQIHPANIDHQLIFWNKKLSTLGAKIIRKRIDNLKVLEGVASKIAKDIYHFGDNVFNLKYINKYISYDDMSEDEIEKVLLEKYENNLLKEMAVGSTLYGPHRDDIEVLLNSKSLKESGSRGQQRLASFIIKLSEYEILSKNKESVILLIDDLPAELDRVHVTNAEKLFKEMNAQVILTAVDRTEYSKGFVKESDLISL